MFASRLHISHVALWVTVILTSQRSKKVPLTVANSLANLAEFPYQLHGEKFKQKFDDHVGAAEFQVQSDSGIITM